MNLKRLSETGKSSEITSFAPIALFVYNRVEHTRRTVAALQKNKEAIRSELFIFSDAPKSKSANEQVQKVRDYLGTIDGFKKITIVEQSENKGLASSIGDGITEVVNKFGRVIVVEDDVVTSPQFLGFMNSALEYYEEEKKVWHISGWNYPIDTSDIGDTFFWRFMNCWGWATWSDRWAAYERNPDRLIRQFSSDDISYLNLDGYADSWWLLFLDKNGKIDTWDIYWYAAIVSHRGLCLNPARSLVENIGNDGSGTNCGEKAIVQSKIFNDVKELQIDNPLMENDTAVLRIKELYKITQPPFYKKVMRKIWQQYIRNTL